jgi:hypothetical protein
MSVNVQYVASLFAYLSFKLFVLRHSIFVMLESIRSCFCDFHFCFIVLCALLSALCVL